MKQESFNKFEEKGIGLPPIEAAYERLADLNVKIYILDEALRVRGISMEDLPRIIGLYETESWEGPGKFLGSGFRRSF
jgi:hypothetical protein